MRSLTGTETQADCNNEPGQRLTRRMRMKTSRVWICLATAFCLGQISTQAAEEVKKPEVFKWGGDLRIREEMFDKMQVGSVEADYFRFRPRVYGEINLDDVAFKVRAANEFRCWTHMKPDTNPQDFPEEWVFDLAYMDIKNLLGDSLDLRIGRQELNYGTGKVICEGTPGDGSRTLYFNAVKATWKGCDKTTVDLLGLYNPEKDDLAINRKENRELTGYKGSINEPAEAGGGMYVINKSKADMPIEAYAIYKFEGTVRTVTKGKDEKGNPTSTTKVTHSADIGTIGGAINPKLTSLLKGRLEIASQFGKRGNADLSGEMIDASLNLKLPVLDAIKPGVDGGVYYLSGNDPKTNDDEGWNPLWARSTQPIDLYSLWYSNYRWSNLLMPYATLSISPTSWLKTSARVAYLGALEKDGKGTGDERGWLETLKAEFTIFEDLMMKKDKLTGHLMLDILQPGDYHASDDTAYFARWNVQYDF